MNALSYITGHLTSPVQTLQINKHKEITNENNNTNNIQEIILKDETPSDPSTHTSFEKTESNDKKIDTEQKDRKLKTELNNNETFLHHISNLKTIRFIWTLVVFFPKYLIIKPLLFVWFVISLPLTLVERGIKLRNRPRRINEPKSLDLGVLHPIAEEDLANGDEFIFQGDTIKGTFIKTNGKLGPSSSSRLKLNSPNKSDRHDIVSDTNSITSNVMFGSKKMGRFLFPKKLIPKSIKHSGSKKTLVIDLDETLIHSVSRGTTHVNSSQGHIVEVKFSSSGISTLYYVHKRPHCDLFLTKVSNWYNIVIFTASMKEYADPVIDWLESSFPGSFTKRLYRNHCTLRDGVGYIKDLSILTKVTQGSKTVLPETGLSEIIIIDNSPVSYAMNVDNAIQVEGWINDPTDTDLLNLIPFLESIRYTTDVRNILALKNGEKSFGTN